MPTNSKNAYDSNSIQNLFKNIATFKKRFDDILIYGDFNFVSINWNSLSSNDGKGESLTITSRNSFSCQC